MTIRSHIDARAANANLGLLESCAEDAPEGTFELGKDVAKAIGEISNHVLATVRALGLKANNADGLREVEAIVYAYIRDSNPDHCDLISAEGFGNVVTAYGSDTRDRVIGQIARDRDELRTLRAAY